MEHRREDDMYSKSNEILNLMPDDPLDKIRVIYLLISLTCCLPFKKTRYKFVQCVQENCI